MWSVPTFAMCCQTYVPDFVWRSCYSGLLGYSNFSHSDPPILLSFFPFDPLQLLKMLHTDTCKICWLLKNSNRDSKILMDMEYRGDQNILGEGTNNKSYMRGRQNESLKLIQKRKSASNSVYTWNPLKLWIFIFLDQYLSFVEYTCFLISL